jgi:protein lysine acetyltransferase
MLTSDKQGRPVVIRPIRPDDKALLVRGLNELSERSVHARFLSPKRSFSRAELRYLTEVDGHDHVAFVAEDAADPTRLIGVGRFVRLLGAAHTAEVAIVVADDRQRDGVGSLLATALGEEALRHDVHRFAATILSDNVAAQRLLTRLTRHLERRHNGAGTSEYLADLAA